MANNSSNNLINFTVESKGNSINENLPSITIVITVLHVITLMVTFYLNIFVICLFSKRTDKKTLVDTLFLLLSITDILICICLTNWFLLQNYLKTWIFPIFMCPVFFLIQTTSVVLNSFCICCFVLITSLNESGLQVRSISLSKVIFVILSLGALIISIPGTVKADVITDYRTGRTHCVDTWTSRADANAYTSCLLIFQYVLPLLLMPVICNICCNANLEQEDLIREIKRNRKIKRLKVAMVTTFAVGWFPQNFLLVLSLIRKKLHRELYFQEIWITCNWFSTLTCCIYPVFYIYIVSHCFHLRNEASFAISVSNHDENETADVPETNETAV